MKKYIFAITVVLLLSCSSTEKKQEMKVKDCSPHKKMKSMSKSVAKVYNSYKEIGPISERKLGEEIALHIYASEIGKPIQNDEIINFVNTLANIIRRISSRPSVTYNVAILNNDKKFAIAVPGGFIFLSSGLILGLDNEAQLAGVIAYQISLIANKVAIHAAQKKSRYDALSSMRILSQKKRATTARKPHNNSPSDNDKRLNNDYEPQIKIAADEEALQYLYDIGYDPQAYLNYLKKTSARQRQKFAQSKLREIKDDDNDLVKVTGRLEKIKKLLRHGK